VTTKISRADEEWATERLGNLAASLAVAPPDLEAHRPGDHRPEPAETRRRRPIALAAAVLVVALLGLGIFLATRRTSSTTLTSETATTTSTPPPVSVEVVLTLETMRTGTTATAQVVVQNDTGQALEVLGCGSTFALALTSASYQPQLAWPTCASKISFPPGRSTYPVTLSASYLACTASTSPSALPACLPSGQPPPLPPGDYRAVLFQGPAIAPSPPGQPIHLTN
jgi:hypothetical protein